MTRPTTHDGDDGDGQAQVLLVSMPFGPLFRPSIGLGLLKSALASAGLRAEAIYFTFRMAERAGTRLYEQIADGYPDVPSLVGEWLFSGSLFGGGDADGYVEEVLRGGPAGARQSGAAAERLDEFIREVLALRDEVEPFLDACLEQVLRLRPAVVGFTSLFQQQVASLALARRIKERAPETFVVFGGANNEGAMGLEVARSFPFVDAVVSGEGDVVFPALVRRVLAREQLAGLPGALPHPDSSQTPARYLHASMVQDMDSLPFPDYEDFFRQRGAARLDAPRPVSIQFETSRGCWWGAKRHCTFCGLNGATMAFRSKSAGRALDELTALSRRYPGHRFEAVDNILDMGYFKDFIPELARRRLNVRLFYEVKANLRKEQVRLLREAGIDRIQPGVESLSTQVLSLMKKGVNGLQNVQLLKWCKELGVRPYWNIIWGFPGEAPEEYARMAALIPLLTHLPPPEATGPVRLDRFSPNFDRAEEFGLTDVRPFPSYDYVYHPLSAESRFNLAYYFTSRRRDGRDAEGYTRPLLEEVARWEAAHDTSDLFSKDLGATTLVCDLRPVARQPMTVLAGLEKMLYEYCDAIQTVTTLTHLLRRDRREEFAPNEVEDALRRMADAGLMLSEDGSYLSLAVQLGEYAPRRDVLERHGLLGAT